MESNLEIVCLDLEGVLIPEIWVKFAENTGVSDFRMTTRDIPNYSELMDQRLTLLNNNNYKLDDVQKVIGSMEPLDGAKSFLDWLRGNFQVIILSDTFYEFAAPLMKKLGWPTLLCHKLVCDKHGSVVDYILRQPDAKKEAVRSFHRLNYRILAAGDSYNDIAMLQEADVGFLFCPPQNVINEFPQFKVTDGYEKLKDELIRSSDSFSGASA